jgi:uncharacterized protein YbjT (DUF2867 family)
MAPSERESIPSYLIFRMPHDNDSSGEGDMILVTGAAGKTGLAVIQALRVGGAEVRALVRREEQVAAAASTGARETVVGDMRDARVLGSAHQSVTAVYHICPNMSPDEVHIGRMMLAAARGAGVTHFVYHSVLHPQTVGMPQHWNKLLVEAALFESGLPYTILQPASYMQNVLGARTAILERGIYPVPYAVETRLSMVDLEDVGQVAARVLTDAGHQGAIYELAGPEILTPREVADVLSRALDRPVRAEEVTLDEWTARARARGMGDYQIRTLLKMFGYYNDYGFLGNPTVLASLLGRPPTSFQTFVSRTLLEGVG